MTEDIDASKVVQPTIDFVDTPFLDAIRNNKRQLRQEQEHVGIW